MILLLINHISIFLHLLSLNSSLTGCTLYWKLLLAYLSTSYQYWSCFLLLGGGEGGSEYRILGIYFGNSLIPGRVFRDSMIPGIFS